MTKENKKCIECQEKAIYELDKSLYCEKHLEKGWKDAGERESYCCDIGCRGCGKRSLFASKIKNND